MTVIDALRDSDLDLSIQIRIANCLKKWGIDFETEKMIDLWRRHADWTFDILAPIQDQKITRDLAVAAASHHILDGKNPAGINPEEIPNESKTLEVAESYEVITMVDKFQAFVRRSGLGHKEAVAVLRGIIDKQSLPEQVKEDYRKILGIIDRSGEKLQTVLKSRT
jgi:HD-GYP domain-containing protein (c-di-GMP phosphodiesterase class II)